MHIVIIELVHTPGKTVDMVCDHRTCWPVFEEAQCRYLSQEQINERYPAFKSRCTICHQDVRIWASVEHMKALGDR